jgi:hypothetical protein
VGCFSSVARNEVLAYDAASYVADRNLVRGGGPLTFKSLLAM